MIIYYRFEGYKELEKRLEEFPQRFRGNAMRGGMRAALKVLKTGAKKRVPKQTGALAKTIRTNVFSFKQGAHLRGEVKAGGVVKTGKQKGQRAWYAHIIERGAKPHVIRPKDSKALSVGGRFAREVKHPGIRASFFMRDTAVQDGPRASQAFIDYVDKRVRDYIAPK